MSDVFVYVESQDGKIVAVSLEALGAARTVADELGEDVTAVVLGHDVAAVAEAAFDYGADNVLGCDDETLKDFRVEAYGPIVSELVEENDPSAFIVGSSTAGRDIAAWVAADAEAGIIAEAVGLEVDDDRIKVTRPVYAAKLLCDAVIPEGLQVITLRSRAFAPAESTGETGDAEWVDAVVDEDDLTTKVTGFKAKDEGISLTEATIIVSGGRGVGGPEGFEPIRKLAAVLNGAVGASRATVDAGWIPYEHQVGQTGKTVSPDLYIACGISGAIQHQAGMRTAKIIVAINKDPEAPIFSLAHYGVVADLFDIVPALEEAFSERLS